MHRNDNSNYFLYIEPDPSTRSVEPLMDEYTKAVQYFFDESKSGCCNYSNLNDLGLDFYVGGGYRGMHTAPDGIRSTSCDYQLSNGFITNSLCVYYTQHYRSSIDGENLKKLEILKELYETKK